MIAVDTSALVNFYNNEGMHKKIESVFIDGLCVLPCVVLSEFLATPKLPKEIVKNVKLFPVLFPADQEFWERSSIARRKLLEKGYKARFADCLIAQLCSDYNVPLITQDNDFKNLSKTFKIKLI